MPQLHNATLYGRPIAGPYTRASATDLLNNQGETPAIAGAPNALHFEFSEYCIRRVHTWTERAERARKDSEYYSRRLTAWTGEEVTS